eukprot:TRINITY_DN24398_c0_g1_i1.p1 TRINITY_DN24398_c0_g1~~TRINITY_DN24398_c0_g1_i1.p1  ORF type:complete len:547 (+),score=182.63 TRINITY_DN24398_c0_g1_i1:65-1642(+)
MAEKLLALRSLLREEADRLLERGEERKQSQPWGRVGNHVPPASYMLDLYKLPTVEHSAGDTASDRVVLREAAKALSRRLDNEVALAEGDTVRVVLLGHSNDGKSSLLNRLVEDDLLYATPLADDYGIVYEVAGAPKGTPTVVSVTLKSGCVKQLGTKEDLMEFLDSRPEEVAVVRAETAALADAGYCIVELPGTDAGWDQKIEEVLCDGGRADIVVFVISCEHLGKQATDALLAAQRGRVDLFVVTKMDVIGTQRRERRAGLEKRAADIAAKQGIPAPIFTGRGEGTDQLRAALSAAASGAKTRHAGRAAEELAASIAHLAGLAVLTDTVAAAIEKLCGDGGGVLRSDAAVIELLPPEAQELEKRLPKDRAGVLLRQYFDSVLDSVFGAVSVYITKATQDAQRTLDAALGSTWSPSGRGLDVGAAKGVGAAGLPGALIQLRKDVSEAASNWHSYMYVREPDIVRDIAQTEVRGALQRGTEAVALRCFRDGGDGMNDAYLALSRRYVATSKRVCESLKLGPVLPSL